MAGTARRAVPAFVQIAPLTAKHSRSRCAMKNMAGFNRDFRFTGEKPICAGAKKEGTGPDVTTQKPKKNSMNTQTKTLMSQRISKSKTCRILFASLSALCLIALSTQAATITVTNTNDSGAGSLRQALAAAADGDTIDFDYSLNGQTITLTSGELLVDKGVIVNGLGPNNLAVDGNHASRVFHVSGDVTATISGLTITNGQASGFSHSDGGGGIYYDQ